MRPDSELTRVLLGRFAPAIRARELSARLGEDSHIKVEGFDLAVREIARTAYAASCVAVLDAARVRAGSDVAVLKAARPTMGIVVLGHLRDFECHGPVFASELTCVSREATVVKITAAVHTAAAERPQRCHGAVKHPAVAMLSGQLSSLTAREREVYECLRLGYSQGEVARALGITVQTARWHIRRVLRKVQAPSKWQLFGAPGGGQTCSARRAKQHGS